eukprot:3938115-Rhodomonas_salina.2
MTHTCAEVQARSHYGWRWSAATRALQHLRTGPDSRMFDKGKPATACPAPQRPSSLANFRTMRTFVQNAL